MKAANNKWWCGYQHQLNVIVDDFDKSHNYMGYYLKIWADMYSFNAEIKNGSMFIRPEHIIVTSNYHPNDIWDDNTTIEPIRRRFKVIRFRTFLQSMGIDIDRDDDTLTIDIPPLQTAPLLLSPVSPRI